MDRGLRPRRAAEAAALTGPLEPGPLAGLRVVELAGIGPAPFAGMLLADLGADVVRVDRPGGPALAAYRPSRTRSAGASARSRSTSSTPAGVDAVVLGLVARADVLVEGFRPGVAERLGVGPDVCLARATRGSSTAG